MDGSPFHFAHNDFIKCGIDSSTKRVRPLSSITAVHSPVKLYLVPHSRKALWAMKPEYWAAVLLADNDNVPIPYRCDADSVADIAKWADKWAVRLSDDDVRLITPLTVWLQVGQTLFFTQDLMHAEEEYATDDNLRIHCFWDTKDVPRVPDTTALASQWLPYILQQYLRGGKLPAYMPTDASEVCVATTPRRPDAKRLLSGQPKLKRLRK